jgi:flagellar motility protein MotE (MotC chaperone)
MAENGTNNNITTRQRRAIAALLSTRNVGEAAAAAHVGDRTLYRWLAETGFKAALVQAEGDAIDQATRRLIGLQDAAIDTLTGVLEDQKATAGVRLRAAQNVLDYLLKLRDLRNVEERLAALERSVFSEHK